ncbi:MAG: M20/M25/M40 family metallo-hydrolase, partial [Saprospiraceae bacterium]|nr:M20/M25/M40 family metallo-hydrolase [Saprospiraceae bacterium]
MATTHQRTDTRSGSEVRPATIDILKDLVGFDTESSHSNLALIDYIERYLKKLGISSQLFYDDEHNKANLYATVGPTNRPGIALSGHTDVVPVAGQDWSSDPWTLTAQNDRYHGRGSCDMKG